MFSFDKTLSIKNISTKGNRRSTNLQTPVFFLLLQIEVPSTPKRQNGKRNTYMNKLITMITLALLPLFGIKGASADEGDIRKELQQLAEQIRQTYIPDDRVELFETDFTISGSDITLQGVTTSADARKALIEALKGTPYTITDRMKVLPDQEGLGEQTYGIVDLSVCNIRLAPYFSAAMSTQAQLGMPVRLLEDKGWYRIQTPDHYIGWVHPTAIHPVTKEEIHNWNKADKLIVTAPYSQVFSSPDEASQPVSDVVAGNRLKNEGRKGRYYKVSYPDGRTGFIARKAAMPEKEWQTTVKHDAQSILHTATRFMGVPYLWAGASTKGVDCSGLVAAVLFLHNVIAPRDADQQGDAGQRIEIREDFGNLLPGDILLFGSKATEQTKENVVHIAFYLGDRKFIHSQGDVHISSFDPEDPLFDSFNLDRLLYASRIIPFINQRAELPTTGHQEFYNW